MSARGGWAIHSGSFTPIARVMQCRAPLACMMSLQSMPTTL